MKQWVQFLQEVRGEFSKVAWPKKDEFVGATIVVLVLVALFAVYLMVLDGSFKTLADYILL